MPITGQRGCGCDNGGVAQRLRAAHQRRCAIPTEESRRDGTVMIGVAWSGGVLTCADVRR